MYVCMCIILLSAGTYMLHVSWNDNDLDQSPYTVIVLDPSNGSTSSRSGKLYSAIMSTNMVGYKQLHESDHIMFTV